MNVSSNFIRGNPHSQSDGIRSLISDWDVGSLISDQAMVNGLHVRA